MHLNPASQVPWLRPFPDSSDPFSLEYGAIDMHIHIFLNVRFVAILPLNPMIFEFLTLLEGLELW